MRQNLYTRTQVTTTNTTMNDTTKLSPAAMAAINAYETENCGDELMPSEQRGLAAGFRAVALYLKHDCQQLLAIAAELEANQ